MKRDFGSKCENWATEYENLCLKDLKSRQPTTGKSTLTQVEPVEITAEAGANRGHHNHRTTNSPPRRGSSIWARARCKYYGGIVGDFVQPTEAQMHQ